ncbi:bifunctional phosphopantothenoylcysteine decarboxylase/phosphopantothenate--cysteine ligase CoaBC [Clostridium sp. MSJ-4]|uniref:Coenzyme A biosynthesis bifunctional protein CoaBC n=1 Tax=Clostridium simiarum TaxID=2841506 RepID=A0ABS6EXR6_9CLOT|nr:bifunctional phosphopantothenoylcysteine decarboxylase/phosphopantothenate--cysteine ligase CoaBC [Clostridium simiarum]MBU5590876.1 bifunctional phosphopantothenoylcysteine decarboxylase/phosphopantothenate--cysteine ligase CoaBC [Clostridium simiarum]
MQEKSNCVVIGVSGGIAAYKALDIISALRKKQIEVNVIMTESATRFVSPLSFQSLSQNMVTVDMFEEPKAWEIQHISLAKKADILLVAPATANIIGKVANGIADDMLSTTIMATKAKVVFAPAMNTNMYENPIVQENIAKLKKYGYEFIEPASGRLACGDEGRGKLADTKYIADKIESMLYEPKDLEGKRVLVTAGPTIAKLDPVRYITNRSTGKMGYAVAEEARDRGAEVILISGPTSLKDPFGIQLIRVDTNEEMLKAVLSNYEDVDIVIKTAAVADYKPKIYSKEKIKKHDEDLMLEFLRDNDILKILGEKKKHQVLVGFAAESHSLLENAEKKLNNKNLDYIVANNIIHTGFASEDNKVSIICKNGDIIDLEPMLKKQVAKNLFDIINKRR